MLANKILAIWAAALMISGVSLANADLHQRTKIAWEESDSTGEENYFERFDPPIVTQRRKVARREFQRRSPCPLTGKREGACPGYVVDHIIALCVGGVDHWTNMKWQTIEEAKEKDRWECDDHWRLVGRR